MSIIDKVRNTIKENHLIKKGDSVLVALSGGSDSVAMLHMLFLLSDELDFKLYAAHLNHNIRKEAKNDEEFVKKYCDELKIKCFVKSVDVLGYAEENSLTTELAGRELRYRFFDELIEKYSIDKLATAHNKNDSAESILLHMTRGCGLEGMCGIPVIRQGYIIRPIIDITKNEVEEYCKNNSLEYVVDKTNFTTDYVRNKIRLNLIPMIESDLNESFINTITNNSSVFKENLDFINNYTKKIYEKCLQENKLCFSELLNEDIAIIKNAVLMHFKNYKNTSHNLSVQHISEIVRMMKKGTTKTVNLPDGISAKIEYGELYFEKTSKEHISYEYELTINQEIYIAETGEKIIIKEEKELKKSTRDKIYFYITGNKKFKIRNRRNKDYFKPVGMRGTKKVSDYFTDLKIPVAKRNLISILTYDDEIVWIVGKRADNRFLKGERLMSATINREEK